MKEEVKDNVGEKEDDVMEKEEMAKRGQQNITPNILPVASSSKKGRQGVQDKSLLNFYFEGKTPSSGTLKPGAYC